MPRRILAIDDEKKWRDDFKRWIPATLAQVDVAANPQEAASCLRRQHYDLVLLDLSMNEHDPLNRDNYEIQRYLSMRPEGTLYLVVSGTINIEEVRNAAFKLNASGVIFKKHADPDSVETEVSAAFEASNDLSARFLAEARRELIGGVEFETELMRVLSVGGAAGFNQVMDAVLRRLVPVASHRHRRQLSIQRRVVVGVLWSRKVGSAVSLWMAHHDVAAEEASAELAEWLGYDHREVWYEKLFHRVVRVQIACEPSLTEELFELPVIVGTAKP